MDKKTLPDRAFLNEMFSYCAETGIVRWNERSTAHFQNENDCRRWNARYAGTEAGNVNNYGYLRVGILGIRYQLHRLIWLMVFGEVPDQVDHIDGNRGNNVLSNLRAVDNQENNKNRRLHSNSSTGYTGVHAEGGKFRARIRVDGKHFHLGTFDDLDGAVAARQQANQRFGFHANHGSHL